CQQVLPGTELPLRRDLVGIDELLHPDRVGFRNRNYPCTFREAQAVVTVGLRTPVPGTHQAQRHRIHAATLGSRACSVWLHASSQRWVNARHPAIMNDSATVSSIYDGNIRLGTVGP